MDQDSLASWDMHSDETSNPSVDEELTTGTCATAVVICQHHFGIGVRLDTPSQYGHVNITEISDEPIAGIEDFPAVGSRIPVVVLGYTGIGHQLRLSVKQSRP